MPTLKLDDSSCWILHEYIRQTRNAPEYGQEHEYEFIDKLWKALIELDLPENKGRTIDVEFTNAQLVQITRQLSISITLGTRFIGQELIRKAFTALVQEEQNAILESVPGIFRDSITSEDSNYLANDRADATTDARGDMSTTTGTGG